MYLCNPSVVPEKFTHITGGAVTLNKHVIIGSGTVILPKVTIGEGSAVGALSLVNKSLDPWGIFFGCPVKRIKNRSRHLLKLEAELNERIAQTNNCEPNKPQYLTLPSTGEQASKVRIRAVAL